MQTRNIDKGIRELLELLPPHIRKVVEDACMANLVLYPQPERSAFRLNDEPHNYGPNSTKICDGLHKTIVFDEMLKDGRCSAPTSSKAAIYTGKTEILLPLYDMIVKVVDHLECAVYNITLPKHIFFPGYVKLVVVEKEECTFVDVSGEGKGNWMLPNVMGGPPLFKTILKEHLVPKVKARLGVPHTFHGHGGSSDGHEGSCGGGGASGW